VRVFVGVPDIEAVWVGVCGAEGDMEADRVAVCVEVIV
jgi:hypothetical protein